MTVDMKHAASMAWVALCVCGCASPPDLQSGWYLEQVSDASGDMANAASSTLQSVKAARLELYVAVINRGETPHKLRCVVVNRTGKSTGWVYTGAGETLEPGQIKVIAESSFKRVADEEGNAQPCPTPAESTQTMFSQCIVPVRVDVVDGDGVVLRLDHAGGLPNVLPGNWQSCPTTSSASAGKHG